LDSRFVGAGLFLLTSCAFGAAAERQEEEKKLQAQLVDVQKAGCMSRAASPTCAGDLHLSYEWPPQGAVEMFCAPDGRPHVKSPSIDAPMPVAVWNALERVVAATEGCVTAYGSRVTVTSKSLPKTCPDPRFDIHELLELANDAAEEGPRPAPRTMPRPSEKCPPFTGPLWLGEESPPAAGPSP
jgi:hypothetical protein